MKIIGKTSEYDGDYICTVSHDELEKYLGLYYGNLERLQVGNTIDLGKGYDYAAKISDAMHKTQEFVKSNQQIVTAILNGLRIDTIMRENPPQPPVDPAAQTS